MNGNAIVLNKANTLTADDLYAEILALEEAVLKLKEKILSILPVEYGSATWWEKMDQKAEGKILAGKGKKFNDYATAIKWLNN